MLLKVVTTVLKEYSGLDYQSEVFCPECIQNEHLLADVKSFEKDTVESNLSAGMDKMSCGCNSVIDLRWLLPGAARVLERRNKKLEKVAMMKRQSESVNSLFQGKDPFPAVVFLLVMEKRRGGEEEAPRLSVGTGFVVNAKEGLIVTAKHVVTPRMEDVDTTVYVGVVGNVVRKAQYKYTASVFRNHPTPEIDVCVLKIDTKLEHLENPDTGLYTIHDLLGAHQNLVNVEEENLVELSLEEPERMQVWELGTSIILLGFPQYRSDEVNGDLNLSMMDGKIQNQGGCVNGEVTVNVNNTR